MATIPNNYLNKPNGYNHIRLLDMAILLFFLHKGAQEPDVGFEDARETVESLTKQLNRTVWVDTTKLESLLWSANLMDEKGLFWHPEGLTFDQWVATMTKKFNRTYNTIDKD